MVMKAVATRLAGLTAMAAGLFAAGVMVGSDGARAADILLSAAVGEETVQLVQAAPKVMQVVVNDKVVYEDRDGASFAFVNAYNLQGRWLVLLRQSADGGCAARFRVLDLTAAKPTVSLPFGTCSEAPQVAMADRTLTVSMPVIDGKGTDGKRAAAKGTAAWNYQEGMLVRVR
ncbi:hypothetical protein [Azospirillum rugosum]|uniref:Uncharacterized protein n=1 Tax=Azospirillum rugosum TaxID=416170 RepID=A0ABS4SKT8_9PROT|nr:hypothetical protein [Azospirillum rugosum]MBP2292030.1 hypothetical protein [Azospirillum rugosum]MDQ0525834.1 hypothetical protein [Azospirillum rugosum]